MTSGKRQVVRDQGADKMHAAKHNIFKHFDFEH